MSRSGVSLDTKDFDMKFKRVVDGEMQELAEKGLFEAMSEACHDADAEKPYIPFKEGHLKGSEKIRRPKRTKGEISVLGGFNIGYAARLHEMEPTRAARINWTRPGSGPKYLEAKLIRNRDKYMKITAERIRRGQK